MSGTLKPLSSFHTKELKQILDGARACGGEWNPSDSSSGPSYKFDDIKAELATREHIPNKKEAKAIRQAAAKRGS